MAETRAWARNCRTIASALVAVRLYSSTSQSIARAAASSSFVKSRRAGASAAAPPPSARPEASGILFAFQRGTVGSLVAGPFGLRLQQIGLQQPHRPAVEHEDIADVQPLDEALLHLADVPPRAPSPAPCSPTRSCRRSGRNRAPRADAACRRRPFSPHDLAEDRRVLLLQRSAAAFEIAQHLLEFFAASDRDRDKRAATELEHLVLGPVAAHGQSRRCAAPARRPRRCGMRTGSRLRASIIRAVTAHSTRSLMLEATRTARLVSLTRMAGAPEPLQRARHALRRGDHDDEIDEADVDAHLQAGRADDRAQLALLQPVLHVEPDLPVERGVVHLDLARAAWAGCCFSRMADALRAAARVA